MRQFIKNTDDLLAKADPMAGVALDLAEHALTSADPYVAAMSLLSLSGDVLRVGDREVDLAGRRIHVIGTGKATFPIARALDEILGDRIAAGLIVCKHGQEGALAHIEIAHAAHPVPDEASVDGARRTVELLKDVRAGDIVIAAVTGGSSALFVAPVPGISLADKMALNRILLTCGANIRDINAVRKHVSAVKAGRLVAGLPAGTTLINLTVSDVIGDALDYITDPTVPDTSTFDDARHTLDKYGLWERLPASVTDYLRSAIAADETPKEADLGHLERLDHILVRADAACHAAAARAEELGFRPLILSTAFEGESRELGRTFAAIAHEVRGSDQPAAAPCVLIGGGETTVTIDGAVGIGGPNQEFAAAGAIYLDGLADVAMLGIDTDGTDGPSDMAGAIVDGGTLRRAGESGTDLHTALQTHDVTPALEQLGCAVSTGATGTNVNDLKLVVIGAER